MIRKAFKYRIYPSKAQEQHLAQFFGCSRFVYNWGLAKKKEAWEKEKKSISFFDLCKELPKFKKQEEMKWLKEADSQGLQCSLKNLDQAYKNFFNGTAKYPRFKKKGNSDSCQFPQRVKADFENSMIIFPKLGEIKAKISKEFEGKIKTVTISKTPSGKYFASVLVEVEGELPSKPKILEGTTIGIDVGLSTYATLSTGEKIENPRWLKKSTRKLRQLSRKHSRKKNGSNNRNKSRLKLAKYHEKVANQRRDFQHKLSKKLVSEN
jgi:putative transposase